MHAAARRLAAARLAARSGLPGVIVIIVCRATGKMLLIWKSSNLQLFPVLVLPQSPTVLPEVRTSGLNMFLDSHKRKAEKH